MFGKRTAFFGVLALSLASACSSEVAGPSGPQPIDAANNAWSFVSFPEAFCDDGTTTGIGVYKTDSPNVIVYFQGGGACWDYSTCFTLRTATHGPFQEAEFEAERAKSFEASVLSSSADKSPYATWNKVFVPYCTGDVHSGSKTATFMDGSDTYTWRHVGRKNAEAYMKRIALTFKNVEKITVSGSSAGGFGAFFNYPLVRDAFPDAKGTLVDDAGPPLPMDKVRPAIRDAFAGSWGSAEALAAVCPECATDWPRFVNTLSTRYPSDRFALISSLQDETIRTFMDLGAPQMEAELRALAKERFDPTPNARYFYTTGSVHTFLGAASTTMSEGKSLNAWLQNMLDGAPTWASVLPPVAQ